VNNPFSPLERELIIAYLVEQGSTVSISWRGGQLFLDGEQCYFTDSEIIFSSPETVLPKEVTVELYFKKRGIRFDSSCKRSDGVYKILIPGMIYKMDDSNDGSPAVSGMVKTAEKNSAFYGRDVLFLDDSEMLLRGEFGDISEGAFLDTEINIQGRLFRMKAKVSSISKKGKSFILSLQFMDIQEEDRRFLFENCYGKKYTGYTAL
jgi:hypothetical protein